MTTLEQAARLALEALEHMLEDAKQERVTVEYWNECVDAITAIREALAEQPALPLPLTDEQINLFINGRGEEGDDDYIEPTGDGFGLTDADLVRLVRRVEAAHGIKGDA